MYSCKKKTVVQEMCCIIMPLSTGVATNVGCILRLVAGKSSLKTNWLNVTRLNSGLRVQLIELIHHIR